MKVKENSWSYKIIWKKLLAHISFVGLAKLRKESTEATPFVIFVDMWRETSLVPYLVWNGSNALTGTWQQGSVNTVPGPGICMYRYILCLLQYSICTGTYWALEIGKIVFLNIGMYKFCVPICNYFSIAKQNFIQFTHISTMPNSD